MYLGSASQLWDEGRNKGPCRLFVYRDMLVVIESPIDQRPYNTAPKKQQDFLERAYITAIAKAAELHPCLNGVDFAKIMRSVRGSRGEALYIFTIPTDAISRVTIAQLRRGSSSAKYLFFTKGNKPLLHLSSALRDAPALAACLRVILGDHLDNSTG